MKTLPLIIFSLLIWGVIHAQNTIQYIPEPAFPDLEFQEPVYVGSPPDGSNRIVVLEKVGNVLVFDNYPEVKSYDVILNLTNKVRKRHLEEGLLGMAFHPQFKKNRKIYLYYSASHPRRTVLSEFKWARFGNKIIENSEKVIMEFNQPYGNHNGGCIDFGLDGYLYISVGDGGGAGDPKGYAQNLKSHLGKILRIDVNKQSDNKNYAIPSDNPYVKNKDILPEIFATGLRNVWRFSFDSITGKLWAADVGQNKLEEINIIKKGKNYGWNYFEGTAPFKISDKKLNPDDFESPVYEYGREIGQSITGGYVYRGDTHEDLYGSYIYADFISGKIWALTSDSKGGYINEEVAKGNTISSFGLDSDKELLIVSLYESQIFKLKKIESDAKQTK